MPLIQQPSDDELIQATENLTLRVANLADAVQTLVSKIDHLQVEVNKKPDDVELKLVAGLATQEKFRTTATYTGVALLLAIVVGVVSFSVANHYSSLRCEQTSENIDTIVMLLDSLPNQRPEIQDTADKLRENRTFC